MLTGINEHFTYDNIYQLTQVVQDLTNGPSTSETYSYDGVGNRLSSLAMSPYSYNTSNQLTSTPAASFTYDNNGNTLTKTDTNGTTQYAWDYENRLTSVTLPNGGGVVTFQYDPFGRRIQKSSASGTTNYVYDGANVVGEYNASAALVAKYEQGAAIDEPLATSRGGTTVYYNADGLGSITSLTDAAGQAQGYYSYDSFGKPIASPSNIFNPFRYTGREWDQETGLYYYRARYYDANMGRFISEDPLEFGGGVDFYAYTKNNPVLNVDPTGLLVEVVCVPVQQKYAGIITGARHCAIHVKYDDVDTMLERLGPTTLNREDWNGRNGLRPKLHRPQGDKCKDFEKCIIKKFQFYADNIPDLPKYDMVKSNSNAFVLDLVRSCGGDLDYPHGFTFRYGYNFFGSMPDK